MKKTVPDHWLFDLDGTLTDSAPGITASVRYALEKGRIPCPDGFNLNVFVGPPLHASFTKYFALDDADADRAVAHYREYYREKGIFENAVYPYVREVLADLQSRNISISLATSKPTVFAEQILHHFELADFFHVIQGSGINDKKSTKAAVIRSVLAAYPGIAPDGFLMIGDRKEDIAGARENGIRSCGVLWGYGSKEELSGADFIVAEIRELAGMANREQATAGP